jgi:hypothetical protein
VRRGIRPAEVTASRHGQTSIGLRIFSGGSVAYRVRTASNPARREDYSPGTRNGPHRRAQIRTFAFPQRDEYSLRTLNRQVCLGLGEAPGLAQQNAELVMRLGKIRVERDGLPERRFRLPVPAHDPQGEAEAVAAIGPTSAAARSTWVNADRGSPERRATMPSKCQAPE